MHSNLVTKEIVLLLSSLIIEIHSFITRISEAYGLPTIDSSNEDYCETE